MLEGSVENRNFENYVEDRNFEIFILKKNHDRMVGSYLDGLILFRLKNNQLSGYDLLKIIHRDFNLLISPGTMYSTLYTLERAGFVECSPWGRKRFIPVNRKRQSNNSDNIKIPKPQASPIKNNWRNFY